ncbi:MAG: hypothetical protein NC212_00020 [Staphylococcus sp.]|nr:hypothetical protein [Staphylococcus sp.]
MKRLISSIIAFSAVIAVFALDFSSVRGVWASKDAEALLTDSVCIFFQRLDNGSIQATLEIPTADFRLRTSFVTRDSIAFDPEPQSLQLSLEGDKLNINGTSLTKVESFDTTAPYDMTPCDNRFDVGKCLQEWRLGVNYSAAVDYVYCEANTNRHMFIYMINPNMVYIRAAATRNNDKGTLFFQNIRMMRNNNTGEATAYMVRDNLRVAKEDLEMDDSQFKADGCTFCPDGGIYWSLISFTPDLILLNGCGEQYQVPRPTKEAAKQEWIEYKAY